MKKYILLTLLTFLSLLGYSQVASRIIVTQIAIVPSDTVKQLIFLDNRPGEMNRLRVTHIDSLRFLYYKTKTQNDLLYKGISYSPSSLEISTSLGYAPYNGTVNPLGFLTSVPAQSFASLTGKPTTLLGYGITDAYPLAGNPSSFINQAGARNSISAGSGISYNSTTGVLTNSSPDQTVVINQGSGITVTGSYPNFTVTNSTIPLNKVFNNNVARTLNSNYTISSTRDCMATYSISLSCTNPLLAGSSAANAFLEYSTDAGTTWITVSNVVNSSSVALAVTIALTQPNTFILCGIIPANGLVRIRSTITGTASVTYTRGQEVYL